MPIPHPFLLLLWTAWVVQALLAVVIVRKFARRVARPRRVKYDFFRPPATVIVPFKGVEADMAGCVKSLCTQNYPNYRVMLVVESKRDPAHDFLAEQLKHYPQCRAEILVAGLAGPRQGQKVHNQLVAIDRIVADAGDDDAWVFADSDAVPGPDWLIEMVGPLVERKRTGATTGYRWLVPAAQSTGRIVSALASVMNSSAACFLGRRRFTYAWGGSMAIRAATARRGDLRGRLRGALTDDYVLTRMCTDLERRVYFAERCLVGTPVSMRFGDLANFAHRQCLITRIYEPHLYGLALGASTLFLTGFVTAAAHSVYGLWRRPEGFAWCWSALACAAVFAANQGRATLRAKSVRCAFDEPTVRRLGMALFLDRWCTPLWMALHWLFLVRAAIGRTMRWRGIRYRLRGPQSVERLDQA